MADNDNETRDEFYDQPTADEVHLLANDGSNTTTPPSPVDPDEKREADKELDRLAREGDGPGATNEVR